MKYLLRLQYLKSTSQAGNQKGGDVMNPIYLIAIINLFALIWAIRSWRKGMREKWMNNLRDSASDLLGAAECIYLDKHIHKISSVPTEAMSLFKNKQHKLLLLFENKSKTYGEFRNYSNELQKAADINQSYRDKENDFSELVGKRLNKEWLKVNSLL
jgi:hypothetical protein